jgi:hypothetical protein
MCSELVPLAFCDESKLMAVMFFEVMVPMEDTA